MPAAFTVARTSRRRFGRGGGTVVNVTSIGGRLVTVSGAYYAASKFAFEAFSESLAMELAEFGIRVRIIEPGATTTSMFANALKATPPNPDSPYQRLARRFVAYSLTQLNKPDATPSDAVARVIEHAIATDDDQLRYVVGEDARLLLAGRSRMSDEELIRYCRLEDDEAYFDAMARVHGRDLFRR